MLSWLWRAMLKFSFNRVYGGDKLETLMHEINSETWLAAQSETGGHALSSLSPIGKYEMISIKCSITGLKSMSDNSVMTEEVSYWENSWK